MTDPKIIAFQRDRDEDCIWVTYKIGNEAPMQFTGKEDCDMAALLLELCGIEEKPGFR